MGVIMAQLEFGRKLRGNRGMDGGNRELRKRVVPAQDVLGGVARGVCVAIISVAHF
jgi:hypothetical protein